MKLNTFLINLLIVATGISVIPVQADSNNDLSDEWGGLMKVKGSDNDRRHREDDDDDRRHRGDNDSRHHEDDNDDRYKNRKYDYSGSQSGYGATRSDNLKVIPRNDKPNFKERMFQQRKKEREQGLNTQPVDQQNQ
jgi:hypothetical protein